MTQIDLMAGVMVLLALAMLVCLTGWMLTSREKAETEKQRQELMRAVCERARALFRKDDELLAKEKELTALRDRADSQESRLRELEGAAEVLQVQVRRDCHECLSGRLAVSAELADDPRYEHMRAAYIALRAAGASIPDELASYFGGKALSADPPAKPKSRRLAAVPFVFRHVDGAPAQLTILRRDIPADAERLVIETHADPIQVVDLLPPVHKE